MPTPACSGWSSGYHQLLPSPDRDQIDREAKGDRDGGGGGRESSAAVEDAVAVDGRDHAVEVAGVERLEPRDPAQLPGTGQIPPPGGEQGRRNAQGIESQGSKV